MENTLPSLPELLESIGQRLRQKNMRLTQPRLKVLEAFLKSRRLQTPQEIFNAARSQGINIGLTTVYRMLEALSELSLARALLLHGEIRYIFCPPEHHHHLICNHCGLVQEVFECPVCQVATGTFKSQSHQLDFYGLCSHCQAVGTLDQLQEDS